MWKLTFSFLWIQTLTKFENLLFSFLFQLKVLSMVWLICRQLADFAAFIVYIQNSWTIVNNLSANITALKEERCTVRIIILLKIYLKSMICSRGTITELDTNKKILMYFTNLNILKCKYSYNIIMKNGK